MASRDLTRSPHIIAITSIQATGTASSSTFLRGDGSWATPATQAHSHAASDITSGTFDIARIPTGTSASTVAFGNHNHDSAYATAGHTHSGFAATTHSHAAGDVTSGTFDVARIPTGTTSNTAALGNHSHTAASIGAASASHTHAATDITSRLTALQLPFSKNASSTSYTATWTPDFSNGQDQVMSATGPVTLNNPAAGTDGQMNMVSVFASGGTRTVSVGTIGQASNVTMPLSIPSGSIGVIGCKYFSVFSKWAIVAATVVT